MPQKQEMDRDDIAERISNQILKLMDGKELCEFCKANFGGDNHQYNESTDTVTFDYD